VATVLIQCSYTGRYFSTGIEIDPDTFELLPETATHVPCPHCGQEHVFAKSRATLVDPNRWSESPKVEDCLRKATECAELAGKARSRTRRQLFLRLEQQWVRLANDFERIAERNGEGGVGPAPNGLRR
jgi:predicted RNA-binding Zn-ribbon protein involved in translation (DUF1610 family)